MRESIQSNDNYKENNLLLLILRMMKQMKGVLIQVFLQTKACYFKCL